MSLVVLSSAIILGSCGQNSTKTTESGTDTSTTTVPVMMNDTSTVSTNVDNSNSNASVSVVVPEKIQASFKTKYPDVKDVKWSRYEPTSSFDWEWAGWPRLDTGDYMGRFNYNNSDYWVWYDNENNWVGSISPMTDFKGLPESVNKVISTSYAGYTIESVDKENDKNRTAYEIDLSKGEDKMKLLIDEKGKVLKKKALTDGVKTKEKMN